ncbi:hypothetical protein BU24DRAFT_241034 [Aaosphaeria arxii CBS 175.79]|uniref:Uncharacterized protein n=1 Tax=Aaosphaeria arxii CBS 175.79 TaxID=1450172 RepID=A0A6A5XLI0_9PLEO|nr:uncharacterized protein BU24DRAFT_241034 [Aaosphaeria arxii CBS 175.79]KAF2013600.1 hypothetical protein BU24DRAFT_241034 [Aaosphaeria arxii CBS 175.79]
MVVGADILFASSAGSPHEISEPVPPSSKEPIKYEVLEPNDLDYDKYRARVIFECDPCPQQYQHVEWKDTMHIVWNGEYTDQNRISVEGVTSKKLVRQDGYHMTEVTRLFQRSSAASKCHIWRNGKTFRNEFINSDGKTDVKARKRPLKITLIEHEPIGPIREAEVWADNIRDIVKHTLSQYNPGSHFTIRIKMKMDLYTAAGHYSSLHARLVSLVKDYPKNVEVQFEEVPDLSLDMVRNNYTQWYQNNQELVSNSLAVCQDLFNTVAYVKENGVPPPPPPPKRKLKWQQNPKQPRKPRAPRETKQTEMSQDAMNDGTATKQQNSDTTEKDNNDSNVAGSLKRKGDHLADDTENGPKAKKPRCPRVIKEKVLSAAEIEEEERIREEARVRREAYQTQTVAKGGRKAARMALYEEGRLRKLALAQQKNATTSPSNDEKVLEGQPELALQQQTGAATTTPSTYTNGSGSPIIIIDDRLRS